MIHIKERVPLAPYTYFKIGGPAAFFAEAGSREDLREALRWALDRGQKFFILGSGSNVLVSDKGFNGLVIKTSLQGIHVEGSKMAAEAGVPMARAVSESVKYALSGFEWGVGVPGSVGGSVRGNAGCYGGEMKDVVESIEVLEVLPDGVYEKTLSNTECEFGYRSSVFKKHPEWIVVSAVLALLPGESSKSQELVKAYSKKRAESQDIGSKCAGCIFKNPNAEEGAGFLVDSAGLKGKRIGGAVVSDKHANFIINDNNATSEDVVMLVSLIKEHVHRKFGVQLEEEIQYVGFE